MQSITLTQKDIEKAGIQNTDSGLLIDELAYSAKQWTSNELDENNMDYEPGEPYMYNFENDLFNATKTLQSLIDISNLLSINFPVNTWISGESNLQAGAQLALNNPEVWEQLLTSYTEKLKDDRTDGVSPAYNTALEKEINEYHDDQYKEWLNGYHIGCSGVIYEIAKYVTDERDGHYDEKNNTYTFTINENDIEKYTDQGYKKNQMKTALLADIKESSNARKQEDKEKAEKRKLERESIAVYHRERKEKEDKERREKLSKMTL